jgi:NAD+ synthase
MPIHQDPLQTDRGQNHIADLRSMYDNVDRYHVDLTETYEQLKIDVAGVFQDDLGLANTRARLRMATLYMCASSTNGLVVGTGNKVEDFGVGFFTKYGDGGVDISPIADLYKTEVYRLASALRVRKDIINAQPTDGLWEDGRTDEDQLGCTYQELEWAMEYDELQLEGKLTLNEKRIMSILNKHQNANMHKMSAIPVYQVRRAK